MRAGGSGARPLLGAKWVGKIYRTFFAGAFLTKGGIASFVSFDLITIVTQQRAPRMSLARGQNYRRLAQRLPDEAASPKPEVISSRTRVQIGANQGPAVARASNAASGIIGTSSAL